MTSADLLAGLVRALDHLAELTALGRDRYDADVLVRLAVQRLWITAGNYPEAYRVPVRQADVQGSRRLCVMGCG